MYLYEKKWTRRELEKHVGRLEQIGGLSRVAYQEGPEAGVELIQVRTAGGLRLLISPSRGMDISLAEFLGVPISWQSANGDVHPAYYDARGGEWARTAAGGLLMTCGLTQVGAATTDNGEELGLHGRVHHIAARVVRAEGEWINEQYVMKVKGIVEETTAFGQYLRLIREYTFFLGENKIFIKDTVENVGFSSTPHMILYHFNFGFPFINEKTRILCPSTKISARDEGTPMDGYEVWGSPSVGYQERVYYHDNLKTMEENGRQYAEVLIANPAFPNPFTGESYPLNIKISWDVKNLPRFTQWKMNGAGTNVLGIEPGNCHVEGRKAERERGSLVMLEPGQALTYDLKLEIF